MSVVPDGVQGANIGNEDNRAQQTAKGQKTADCQPHQ